MRDPIERAFVEALIADPRDEGTRAVYADWLEQRGDPRCELLRLATRVALPIDVLPTYEPRWQVPDERWSNDRVDALAFAPSSRELVVASRYGFRCFALGSREPRWRAIEDSRHAGQLRILDDGRVLTLGEPGRLVERDPATGAERRCWGEGLFHGCGLSVSRDGALLGWTGSSVPGNPSGYSRSYACAWSIATGEQVWTWDGKDWQSPSAGAFVGDAFVIVEREVASAHDPRTERVLDQRWVGYLTALTAIRRGRMWAGVAPHDRNNAGMLGVWSARTLEREEVLPLGGECLAVDERRGLVAVGCELVGVRLVRLKGLRAMETVRISDRPEDRVTAIAISPSGAYLAVGTESAGTYLFGIA